MASHTPWRTDRAANCMIISELDNVPSPGTVSRPPSPPFLLSITSGALRWFLVSRFSRSAVLSSSLAVAARQRAQRKKKQWQAVVTHCYTDTNSQSGRRALFLFALRQKIIPNPITKASSHSLSASKLMCRKVHSSGRRERERPKGPKDARSDQGSKSVN